MKDRMRSQGSVCEGCQQRPRQMQHTLQTAQCATCNQCHTTAQGTAIGTTHLCLAHLHCSSGGSCKQVSLSGI